MTIDKMFFSLSLFLCLSSSASFAQSEPAIVQQARSDMQKFSGKTGKLTVLIDGQHDPMFDHYPCQVRLQGWFPEHGKFAVYSLQFFETSGLHFVLSSVVKQNWGAGEASRKGGSTPDTVTYSNNFDHSNTGDLGTMYCGSYGHLSVSPYKVRNELQILSNLMAIRILYSCPFYSPEKRSGKHELLWQCEL